MSDLIKKQFELTRTSIFKTIEQTASEKFNVKPQGYNNTIHWQLGHILVAAEQFLFGGLNKLPEEYGALFSYGSSPSDWQGDVPTVANLVEQLKGQLQRIKEIPNERFQEKLPKRILGNHTFDELASFAAYHESNHTGQIHAMSRFLA
ncbi:MAG TPA: DinB family protein [Bacillus bacterium]|nr:DinB family protein [Bacillus sp. (in: firmicutes)]